MSHPGVPAPRLDEPPPGSAQTLSPGEPAPVPPQRAWPAAHAAQTGFVRHVRAIVLLVLPAGLALWLFGSQTAAGEPVQAQATLSQTAETSAEEPVFVASSPLADEPRVAEARTAEQTPHVSAATAVTHQPPTANAQALSLEDAKARVRAFLGEPGAALEGYAVDETTDGGRAPGSRSRRFYLHRPGAAPTAADNFIVDGATGEVVQAILPVGPGAPPAGAPVTDDQARRVAEAFARARFAGFETLTLYEEGTTPTGGGRPPLYQATWQRRAAGSGAWLPVAVTVDVSRESGKVVRYFARRAEFDGPTTPAVARERAADLALAEARKDARLATAKAARVELRVGAVAEGFRLVWFVGLDGVPAGVSTRYFHVDALSGAVLNPLGSPVG